MSLFHDQGVRSSAIDRLRLIDAESIAKSFATCLMSAGRSSDRSLQIVVANDGLAGTAALNAAVCENILRGVTVLDAGPASAACLVHSIENHQADGGLLIGTPSGYPNGAGIKFWTGNEPVSRGELLTRIETAITHHPPTTAHYPFGNSNAFLSLPPISMPFVRFTMPCVHFGLC